jgi:selenocysteine lyase/cysteine desulfurase
MLTHVHNETGRQLPVEKIIQELRDQGLLAPEGCAVVVDGAQAAGNVDIPKSLLGVCTYYATCGHKWLLGEPSLGILYRNDALPELFTHVDTTRGLSALEGTDTQEAGLGTINLASHVSLNASLVDLMSVGMPEVEQHNRALAERFVDGVRRSGLPLEALPNSAGGMVVLTGDDPAWVRKLGIRLSREHLTVTPNIPRRALRLTMHYYHNDEDIATLIESIQKIAETLA